MAKAKGGLGRGLGALLSADPATQPRERPLSGPTDGSTGDGATNVDLLGALASFREVSASSIRPNPRQPRQEFDAGALAELVASIREVGVLQPPVVRELGPDSYELVMGERRLRACKELGMDVVPVIVRTTPDDAMLRDALLENLHRQELNPLEEAGAYVQLLADFGATQEQLAARIGRSRPQIANTIRLLNLPPGVQRRVAAGVLSAGHARALLSLSDPAEQEVMAGRIVAEGLSVRSVEELVALARPSKARRAPTVGRVVDPEQQATIDDVVTQLEDTLETRVRVELGRVKGTLVIDVSDLADLERIRDLIVET